MTFRPLIFFLRFIQGLTYNGLDEKEKPKWDGCSNVKLKVFETSTKMNHYIESFNINTNQWIAQLVFKRLMILKIILTKDE